MRVFLRLAYNGKNFHGWQRQPNASSVQETIEEALSTILRQNVEIIGAGRTDTGVHAREMFAHFDTDFFPNERIGFLNSLNKLVGRDIAIYDILPVKDDAHARFDALSRTYRYYITSKKTPFNYDFSYRIEHPLDVDAMNLGAKLLLETEDFTSFAKLHTDTKTNICNVTQAKWEANKDTASLVFTIKADRFLRNMVRSVVGTLIMVGTHKIDIEDFKNIIMAKDRCAAGTSAPAQGLFLEKIEYPSDIFFKPL